MFQIRLQIPNKPSSKETSATTFSRKTVPDGRATYLVNELVSVQTTNVSLVVEFANVTDYEQLLVFVRFEERPNLVTQEYDVKYLINVTGTFSHYNTKLHMCSMQRGCVCDVYRS